MICRKDVCTNLILCEERVHTLCWNVWRICKKKPSKMTKTRCILACLWCRWASIIYCQWFCDWWWLFKFGAHSIVHQSMVQIAQLMKRRTQIYMMKLKNQLDLLDLGNNSCSNIKFVMVWASLLGKEGQSTPYFRKIRHLVNYILCKIALLFPTVDVLWFVSCICENTQYIIFVSFSHTSIMYCVSFTTWWNICWLIFETAKIAMKHYLVYTTDILIHWFLCMTNLLTGIFGHFVHWSVCN